MSEEEVFNLKEGVVLPDKWKDYPHHHGKSQEIRKYLNMARSYHLNDDRSNALLHLGIALHYIQDSYTTYPSFLPKHQEWEEWIENSYIVSDIEDAIKSSNMSLSMKRRSSFLAEELSREVQGRNQTLNLATLNEEAKEKETIASPKVDLNLGFLASYLVCKSILSPKRNPFLDAQLIDNLNRFENLLKSTESEASAEIIRLVNERNEQAQRIGPPNGLFAKLKNWLTNRRVKALDKRATMKMASYVNKEHLAKVANQYGEAAYTLTRDHEGWYFYSIPPIDISIIRSELVDVKVASVSVGLELNVMRGRLFEQGLPIYLVGGCELVEGASIDRLMTRAPPMAIHSP